MIKLIASDMDGTLLNDEKQLPGDFFEVLDRLLERGIVFTVASGRTYSAVDHLFPTEYRDKISYICDNGACTYRGGKPVHITALEKSTYLELLDACGEIGGLKLVVCAANGVYHLRASDEFSNEVGRFYRNHKVTDSFRDIDDTIYKLAVCDMQGTMTHGKPALDRIFGERLNVQVSGEIWMDVMAAGVSKGNALRELQRALGAAKEETMAFGDYFNDLDMLTSAGLSVCPENGHEDIKKLCSAVCADNNHGGVTACIKRYALGETAGVKK